MQSDGEIAPGGRAKRLRSGTRPGQRLVWAARSAEGSGRRVGGAGT